MRMGKRSSIAGGPDEVRSDAGAAPAAAAADRRRGWTVDVDCDKNRHVSADVSREGWASNWERRSGQIPTEPGFCAATPSAVILTPPATAVGSGGFPSPPRYTSGDVGGQRRPDLVSAAIGPLFS